MFLYRRANDLSKQRLCQQTRLRMIRSGGGNWTTVAVDKMFSTLFAKSCRATQFLENVECGINPLFATFRFQAAQMFPSHFSAGGPHSSAQILRLNLPREYRHQKRNQSPICLGKKVFGFRTERIRDVRFADARPHSRLHHESVTLQTGKVRSDGVISQVQFVCELVDSAVSCAQKVENFAAGAFEQPLAPAYMFH